MCRVPELSIEGPSTISVLTEQLLQKADEIAKEFNRATKAALNAEQRCWPVPALVPVLLAVKMPTEPLLRRRKAKASLLEVDLPALQKLVKKGKTTPEQLKDREAKVPLLCCSAQSCYSPKWKMCMAADIV